MTAFATTIVLRDHPPIHWEAVLVTAVPATLSLLGTIAAAVIGLRNKRKVEGEIVPQLVAVNRAVNGVDVNEPTLRENVAALAEHTLTPEQRPDPSTVDSRAADAEAREARP